MLQDALIPRQTLHGLRSVYAPKVQGGLNLASALSLLPSTGLQAFSSVATTMGSPGQANYAAANSALDALLGGLAAAGSPGKCLATARVGRS